MARFVTSILIASAVVGASMATLAIQPDTVPGRPALTADPLMTRLLEAYRIQGGGVLVADAPGPVSPSVGRAL